MLGATFCSHCHKLMLLSADLNTPVESHSRASGGRSVRLFKKPELYPNYDFIAALKEELSEYNFPICGKCLSLYLERVTAFTSFFEEQVEYTNSFLSGSPEEHRNIIETKISSMMNEVTALSEVHGQYASVIKELEQKEYNQQQPETVVNEQMPPPSLHANLTALSFYIQHKEFYGTINGLRLGTNTPTAVPYEELSAAFSFLGHMLIVLSDRLEYNLDRSVKMGPTVTIRINDKDIPLTVTDLKSRNGIAQFNIKLGALVRICEKFFTFLLGKHPSVACPFMIDTQKKMIGQNLFEFKADSPYQFTHAMKLLLLNFKYIQFHAFV